MSIITKKEKKRRFENERDKFAIFDRIEFKHSGELVSTVDCLGRSRWAF